MIPKTEAYISTGGARIYRIPIHLFPDLWGYVHFVITDDLAVLVDVGSGFGESNEHLALGFQSVRDRFGEGITWEGLTHILITHGHIDHFGGLGYVRERTSAPVGIHELDRRVLTGYEERVATVANRLGRFLKEAGVSPADQEDLMNLYLLGKQLFSSQPVDFTYEAAGMKIGPLQAVHVPGHTPGQVVLMVHDVLLSADHILEKISPHLAPERLTLTTGLDHYLESLERTRMLVGQTKLVLGGHERPFTDLERRINETSNLYQDRLAQVIDIAASPRSTFEIAQKLFGETAGYHRLLAMEEAGAYVEYLSMRGYLAVHDLESLENGDGSPILYHRVDGLQLEFPRSDTVAVGDQQIGELDVRI